MESGLKTKAFIQIGFVLLFAVALIFGSAGSLNYWQGWLFLLVYAAACLQMTLSLMQNDPALFKRRMSGGPKAEKRPAQKLIMLAMTIMFCAIPIVGGLDFRFSWSHLPSVVAIAGDCLMVLSFVGIHFVFRENSFASSTIEIAEDQKVISTGPYALVRHPMYSASLLLLLGMPLALGSLWALAPLTLGVPILCWRIIDEEKLLKEELPGYSQYCQRVRYRLIPGLY